MHALILLWLLAILAQFVGGDCFQFRQDLLILRLAVVLILIRHSLIFMFLWKLPNFCIQLSHRPELVG